MTSLVAMHRVALLGLVFSTAILCWTQAVRAADTQDLIYRVTIRDFIPGVCFGLNATMKEQWEDIWGTGQAPTAAKAKNCPFKDKIVSGELLPNLDFQPYNFRDGFPDNTGRNITFTLNGAGAKGAIQPVVNNTLKADNEASGILKPQYCTTDSSVRCGQPTSVTSNSKPASAGLGSFESWYADDRRINRRIGVQIILKDPEDDGTFLFDSGAFFDPLSEIPHVDPAETNPDNALRWDKRNLVFDNCGGYAQCEVAKNNPFFLTTEMHTFFQYRGGETFVFSGDDDVWIFINDKLAISLGGMHGKIAATILMDDNKDFLGLELNKTYSLDLFHAERHTHESNFRLSTTLVSACNVLQSGSNSIALPAVDGTESKPIEWVTSRGASVGTDGVITLTDGLTKSASEFVYHPTQQNVGAGFVLEFDFVFPSMRTASSDGFAFVVHSAPDGLDDLPTSTSGNLGFRFLRNSAVLALDMCPDRPNCASNTQRLSLHYAKAVDGEFNDASERTRFRTAMVPNPLNKNGTRTTMRVVYYENPSYLEVYLDDSLYLVDKEFDPITILGGRNAYVGFTTGTSAAYAAGVQITRWEMDTVGVSVPRTTSTGSLVGDASKPLVTIDGVDEAVFTIETADKCGVPVNGGGLKELLDATMVVSPAERRFLAVNGSEGENNNYGDVRIAVQSVKDNLDGTYSVIFTTTVLGPHDLFIRFGDECAEGDAFEAYEDNMALANAGKSCWTESYTNAMDTQSQPTTSPTIAGFVPETFSPTPGPADETVIVIVGASTGAAVLLCMGCGILMICYRRKWVNDQGHLERGRLEKEKEGIEYDDGEIQDLQRQYQEVQQQLLREKAQSSNRPNNTADINRIQVEMQSIADHMRYLKQKKQRSSNHFSMRMSRILGPRQPRRQFGGNGAIAEEPRRGPTSFKSSKGSNSSSSVRNFVVPDPDVDLASSHASSNEPLLPRQSSPPPHSLAIILSSVSSVGSDDNFGDAREATESIMSRSASVLDSVGSRSVASSISSSRISTPDALGMSASRFVPSVSSMHEYPDVLAPSAAYDSRQAVATATIVATATNAVNLDSVSTPDLLLPSDTFDEI